LRIGIGRFTSPTDVDRAAAALAVAWRRAMGSSERPAGLGMAQGASAAE
jgi:cysteine desulfurase